MKKIILVLSLSFFVINAAFSQMSFKTNQFKDHKFSFKEKSLNTSNNSASNHYRLLGIDENHEVTKNWRSTKAKGEEAVSGFFIYASAGYGLKLGSQTIVGFTDKTIDTAGFATENQLEVSLGKGLCFKLGGGYMVNGNFGFELGASYLLGANSASSFKSDVIMLPDNFLNTVKDVTYKPSFFIISPSIIVSAGLEVVNPYAKFGMSIGFGSFNREESTTLTNTLVIPGLPDSILVNNAFKKEEFSGGVSIGFNATLGCAFRLDEKFSFFAEFNFINMTYSPDKSEITEYTIQGVDNLPMLTIKQKQTNYYETLLTTPLTSIPDTEPNQRLKQAYSLGSIGFNIGLKINF
jgi:hypothetical protein